LRLAFKLQGDLAMADNVFVLAKKGLDCAARSALFPVAFGMTLCIIGCMQASPPLAPRPATLTGSERQVANYSSERVLVGSPGRPQCLLSTDQIAAFATKPGSAGEVSPLALSQDLITFVRSTAKIVECTVPDTEIAGKPEHRIATLFRCEDSPRYLTCERESTTSSQGDSWKCLPADGSTGKPEDSEVVQPGC
jgi:hypothetical protein